MTITVKDEFEEVDEVFVDDRHRVALTAAMKRLQKDFGDSSVHFRVFYNHTAGLIMLQPATTIPLHEVWLYKNPTALKSVLTGIAEAEAGQVGPALDMTGWADESDDE